MGLALTMSRDEMPRARAGRVARLLAAVGPASVYRTKSSKRRAGTVSRSTKRAHTAEQSTTNTHPLHNET